MQLVHPNHVIACSPHHTHTTLSLFVVVMYQRTPRDTLARVSDDDDHDLPSTHATPISARKSGSSIRTSYFVIALLLLGGVLFVWIDPHHLASTNGPAHANVELPDPNKLDNVAARTRGEDANTLYIPKRQVSRADWEYTVDALPMRNIADTLPHERFVDTDSKGLVCIVVRTYAGHARHMARFISDLQQQSYAHFQALFIDTDIAPWPHGKSLAQLLLDTNDARFKPTRGRANDVYSHIRSYYLTDAAIRECPRDAQWLVITNADNAYHPEYLASIDPAYDITSVPFFSRYWYNDVTRQDESTAVLAGCKLYVPPAATHTHTYIHTHTAHHQY
jgi:hypothetical protein